MGNESSTPERDAPVDLSEEPSSSTSTWLRDSGAARSEINMDISDESDDSSVLSDAPSLTDEEGSSDEEPFSPDPLGFFPSSPCSAYEASIPTSPLKRKTFPESSYRCRTPPDSDVAPGDYIRHLSVLPYAKKRKVATKDAPLAPIERLPNEILQRVVVDLCSDADLHNLALASPAIANSIIPENSEVWRYRFLAFYDHPKIHTAYAFSVAYKYRRYMLRTFSSFDHDFSARHVLQLEAVRDMLLETYMKHRPHLPAPRVSRNLRAMASPSLSPWIQTLLSCPFPGFEDRKYGYQSKLFETIQVVFSHLLLSPTSALAHTVSSSRSNYDIEKVYNFNKRMSTLYTRRVTEEIQPPTPSKSKMFPNLKTPSPKPPTITFDLNTNALLHIRNFWHRHLIDDSEPSGEHTYAAMARGLLKLGYEPREWGLSLGNHAPINGRWHGHYSAVYPWPTSARQLEERQSIADDWQNVDPMMLDFVSTNDYAEGFWPPEMSSFPAFHNTVPEPSDKDYQRLFDNDGRAPSTDTKNSPSIEASTKDGPVYIRGIAPFIDLPTARGGEIQQANNSTSSNSPAQPVNKAQRYHPFVALRIRGVIYDIPASATISHDDVPGDRTRRDRSIPGWKRIVMVMYKPNVRYLLQVLEHAAEDYGGTYATQITNTVNGPGATGLVGGQISGTNLTTNTSSTTVAAGTSMSAANTTVPLAAVQPTTQQVQPQPQPLQIHPAPSASTIPPLPTPPLPISPQALHAQLLKILHARLATKPTAIFTPSHIITIENNFSPPHTLDWTDNTIDFAYAYEGVIIPGGKIMMGRWWRCHGAVGLGEGREVDCAGEGVDVIADEEVEEDEEIENGRRERGLERGPFVFWC